MDGHDQQPGACPADRPERDGGAASREGGPDQARAGWLLGTDTSRSAKCAMLALLRYKTAGYGLVPHHHAEEHASSEYPICSLGHSVPTSKVHEESSGWRRRRTPLFCDFIRMTRVEISNILTPRFLLRRIGRTLRGALGPMVVMLRRWRSARSMMASTDRRRIDQFAASAGRAHAASRCRFKSEAEFGLCGLFAAPALEPLGHLQGPLPRASLPTLPI
jgi:hypothetical protein